MKEEQERQSEMDNYNIFLKIVLQYKYQYQLYHKNQELEINQAEKDIKCLEGNPRKEQQEEP